MKYYSYEEFVQDTKKVAKDLKASPFKPDVILAIARGGLTFGHFLAEALEMRDLYSLNSIHYEETRKLDTIDIFNIPNLNEKTNILLLDDIIDSGETMIEIKRVLQEQFSHLNIKTATLFYKDKALMRPDFTARHADDWIEFFWYDVHK